jgi:raffinose/stachyose/melibiose transport system permease protein
MAPSFTIIAILTFIGAFEWFELPYVIGGVTGQPGGSTTTMALLFYRLAFGTVDSATVDVGMSSAIGVILFLFVGIARGEIHADNSSRCLSFSLENFLRKKKKWEE